MHLKTSSAKWRPFCPGGDELRMLSVLTANNITGDNKAVTLMTFSCPWSIQLSSLKPSDLQFISGDCQLWCQELYNTPTGLNPSTGIPGHSKDLNTLNRTRPSAGAKNQNYIDSHILINKQRVLMHRHQGWNVRHGLCHIYMRYIYIWVVYSFCLFCCLFIIVTWWYIWCIVWQVASKRKYRHVW